MQTTTPIQIIEMARNGVPDIKPGDYKTVADKIAETKHFESSNDNAVSTRENLTARAALIKQIAASATITKCSAEEYAYRMLLQEACRPDYNSKDTEICSSF